MFYPSLFALILLLNWLYLIESKSLIINYQQTNDGLSINLDIGNPPRRRAIFLTFRHHYLWFNISSVNLQSQTFKSLGYRGLITLNQFFKEEEANSFSDQISMNEESIIIDNFQMYYVNIKSEDFVNGLGLGCLITNPSFSLLYLLKEKQFTDNMSFGFSPIKFGKGEMFFGKIPNSYKMQYPYHVNWNVKNDWECYVSHIMIGKSIYKYNYKKGGKIHTDFNGIIAPNSFMEFLLENVFKEKVQQGGCRKNFWKTKKSIVCTCSEVNSFPDIVIFIHGKGITFTKDVLFNAFIDDCDLIFEGIDEMNEEFVFGTSFLSSFISWFDYDNKTISLYSNVEIIDLKETNNNNILFCLFFIIIQCIIITGILGWMKIKVYKQNILSIEINGFNIS